MRRVAPSSLVNKSGKVRELLQAYLEAEDLINIGAYTPGANTRIDEAVEMKDKIWNFLHQSSSEGYTLEQTIALIDELIPDGKV
jgi:flagellar biosynthesis/type III secretory pathway ATPase